MFVIDNIEWDIPCQIARTAEMKESGISGYMLDKSYFNDVLGTYMSYTITLAVPLTQMDKYAKIYEMLTKPVDGHEFVLPYNESTLSLTARVSSVADVYVRLPNGRNAWKGVQFTIVGNYPTKTQTLNEAITAGRAPLPPISMPEVGDTYTYTANGWQKV